MKSKLLALALVSAGLVSSSAVMAASTTHVLSVSAAVTGNCRFNTAGPTALAFGAIDPSTLVPATATASVTFRCSTGTTSSMTSDDGLNETGVGAPRMFDGTNYLPYTMALVGSAQLGTGHGAGQDKTLTVNGSVAVADFQNATASAGYVDTVTLTIAP